MYDRQSFYLQDFDLVNFKCIGKSRVSLPSGNSSTDPMGYIYSEVYNRYLSQNLEKKAARGINL